MLTTLNQKLVRHELDCLLKEDLPYGHIPEPSQVSAFMAEWERTGHGAKACDATPADFMINIAGEPRTPWNIAGGCIFTDHFIHKMEYDDTQETCKAVEKRNLIRESDKRVQVCPTYSGYGCDREWIRG